MKNKYSLRIEKQRAVILTAVLAAAALLCILYGVPETRYRVILASLFGAALVFSWGLLFKFERRVTDYFDGLDVCLDRMMNRSEDILLPLLADPESVMARAQAKLERIYTMLTDSDQRSQHSMEEIQGLIADISHQVKTPTSNIKMYLSILSKREMERNKQREFLALASAQAEKLEFLIQSMIEMSRLETGVIQLNPRPASVHRTLADALGGVLLKAEEKKISVSVQCPDELCAVHDPKWTVEALFNILDNAVKYTQEKGTIRVTASRWECYTRIDVQDDGRGIAEAAHGAVFKRFYREQEVSDISGVGLGLYLARRIVSLQNGYISLSSEPGQGSCFSVFLPNE